MKTCIIILLVTSLRHVVSAENWIGDSGTLIFASVIYRNGDRTPLSTYPTDPYANPAYWDENWGQLTNIGKQEQYLLGEWLMRRYSSILNKAYSENEISIDSTSYDRTIESAMSNLAGMYPPFGKFVWNPNIDWQPIAVRSTPNEYDFLMGNPIPKCPAYEEAFDELMSSDKIKFLIEDSQPLFNFLSKSTGMNITSPKQALLIFDNLLVNSIYHKNLPAWSKSIYPGGQLEKLARVMFSVGAYNPTLARLRSGFLFKQILDRSLSKSHETLVPNRSVNVYSAHGSTIANMLSLLRMYNENSPPPPYSSAVLIEIRSHLNKTYVEVYYKNSTDTPAPKYIPNCGFSCPLEKMYILYKDVLPTADFQTECKSTKSIFTRIGLAFKEWF